MVSSVIFAFFGLGAFVAAAASIAKKKDATKIAIACAACFAIAGLFINTIFYSIYILLILYFIKYIPTYNSLYRSITLKFTRGVKNTNERTLCTLGLWIEYYERFFIVQ